MPIFWNVFFHKSVAKIRFSQASYVRHTLNSSQIINGSELAADGHKLADNDPTLAIFYKLT